MGQFTLPPEQRVRSKGEFTEIINNGKRLRGKVLIMFCTAAENGLPRIGISIGRSYGNAVRRNRFKRLVREAFRLNKHELPSYDIIIIPVKNPGCDLTLERCTADILLISEETLNTEKEQA